MGAKYYPTTKKRSNAFFFLMNFDHIPGDYSKGENYSKIETSQFDIPKKTIKDYKKNIFIINLLKQRLWLLEGQVLNYERLQNQMKNLVKHIEKEITND